MHLFKYLFLIPLNPKLYWDKIASVVAGLKNYVNELMILFFGLTLMFIATQGVLYYLDGFTFDVVNVIVTYFRTILKLLLLLNLLKLFGYQMELSKLHFGLSMLVIMLAVGLCFELQIIVFNFKYTHFFTYLFLNLGINIWAAVCLLHGFLNTEGVYLTSKKISNNKLRLGLFILAVIITNMIDVYLINMFLFKLFGS